MPWDLETPKAFSAETLRVLSPHHLASYRRCPKQFELQTIQDLRWPEDPSHFEFGTAVHYLLDAQAKGLPLEPLKMHATPDMLSAFEALLASPWGQARVLASEWDVSLFVQDVCIQARVDRIVQLSGVDVGDPEATFAIIDWKTGTATPKFPETHWQTRIYFLVLRSVVAQLGIPQFRPHAWSMVYVETDRAVGRKPVDATGIRPEPDFTPGASRETRETVVTCTAAWLDDITQALHEQLRQMRPNQHFTLPSRCPDRFCSYEPICGIRGAQANSTV
jgi:PD-(D/E)XK nuclease superfamily